MNQELNLITLDDTAIDPVASNIVEYLKTRDIELLKFHEGKLPYIFKIMRLSSDMLLRLKDFSRGDKTTYRYLCFLASCHQYSVGDETVSAELIENTKLAEDAWIEKLREEVGIEAVEELVAVAYRFQSLSKRNPSFV